MVTQEWLSTREAADRLGITLRTVYALMDKGCLKAYKFGRVIRTTQQDIETCIMESQVEVGSLKHLYPESKKVSS